MPPGKNPSEPFHRFDLPSISTDYLNGERPLCFSTPARVAGTASDTARRARLPTGLTSHFRLFHVAYDGLPTVIDVDVLDANVLLPTVTKPSKHLDLGRIGS